jgi:phage-related minor tail protein
MASRIKGITIELGADTTSLEGALSDVNKKSKNLATELKDVEKLLKFNPNSVELLAQKQQILSESVETTRKKLDQLKEAEAQVQQQFQRGDIKEEQYRAFQRELQDTERTLQRFENSLQDMQVEQDKVGQSQKDLATLMSATETSIEDYADAIGHRLVRSIQNGTATSRDLERAIQRIGREALGADVDVDRLTRTLRSVDDGNSLQEVRRELQRIEDQSGETVNALEELDYGIENVAGALVAGDGISGAIEKALETTNLDTKIDISFDIPEESKKAVTDAIRTVEAYGVDSEASLEGVRRQWALNKDATDQANEAVVEMAATIAGVNTQIDFNELIQEGNEIAATLGISNEEAMGFVKTLLDIGFPPEQLDIIAEYGDQMIQAGFSAKEVQQIMAAGIDTKSWNIDNLLDGVKEGRIQMADFGSGTDKATREIIDSAGIAIDKFEAWGDAIAKGGEKGQVAMLEATKALAGVKDETDRNQLGTKMFGTMWEDQGTKIIDTILKAEGKQVDLRKGVQDLNNDMAKWQEDPTISLQLAFAELTKALKPLLEIIASIIAVFANWVSENPKLAATITALGTAIGIVAGLILALAPIFFVLQSAAAAAGVGIGTLIAPFLTMAGIVLGIITVIGLLVAAFVNLYQNNEDFRNKVQEIWTSIQEVFFNVLNYIKELVSTIMTEVMTFFGEILGKIKAFWDENGQAIMILVEMYMNYIKGIIEIIMIVIKGLFQAGWTAITTVLKIAWELIKSIVKTGIDLVLGIIQTVLKLLQGDWEGAWNTIKDTVKSIWNNIKEFFENVDLLQTGKNIIQGLIDGIGSMGRQVWDKVTSIGQSIKDGFTSFFDIHSPSRLMRDDIGKNIGLGLKEGLEEAESKVYNASRNLQEAAKPEISKNNQSNVMSNPYDDSEVISLLRKIASKNLTIDSNALMDFINTRQANEINFINAMKG